MQSLWCLVLQCGGLASLGHMPTLEQIAEEGERCEECFEDFKKCFFSGLLLCVLHTHSG